MSLEIKRTKHGFEIKGDDPNDVEAAYRNLGDIRMCMDDLGTNKLKGDGLRDVNAYVREEYKKDGIHDQPGGHPMWTIWL